MFTGLAILRCNLVELFAVFDPSPSTVSFGALFHAKLVHLPT